MRSLMKHFENFSRGYIFIAGPTCSGKTTLSHKILNHLSDRGIGVTYIQQDNYFKDLENIPKCHLGYLTDSINAFHVNELKQDFKDLIKNGKAALPLYDISKNKRLSSKEFVTKSPVILVEGLHAISIFHNYTDSMFIYVDTDIEICLKRRIERDKRFFGVASARVTENFHDCIMPMYEQYILPQKKFSDVILYDGGR